MLDQLSDQQAYQQEVLQVLPQGQNRQQKIAVGDSAGVVQCLSVKKGEVAVAFKTLPTGHKVSYVALGKGQPIQRDKIFIAQGQAVSHSRQCIAGIVLGHKSDTFCCVRARYLDLPRRANNSTASTPTWLRQYLRFMLLITASG